MPKSDGVSTSGVQTVTATLAVAVWAASLVAAPPEQTRSPASDPSRAAVMQHHFVAIARVHEAVIRGDLVGIRGQAAELASMPIPAGLAIDVEPFVSRIRQAGRLAGSAPNLRSAAAATVAMLRECGDCHRAVGTYPALKTVRRPELGGIVGHMLGHLDAADDLLEGLVVPSDVKWRGGAEKLQGAALRSRDLPADLRLRSEIRAAEAAVHTLADRAREATTSRTRGAVYGELVMTCATCHSLHPRVWGPSTR